MPSRESSLQLTAQQPGLWRQAEGVLELSAQQACLELQQRPPPGASSATPPRGLERDCGTEEDPADPGFRVSAPQGS